MFTDRTDAGRQLAKKLEAYRGKNTIVLALPRGGVVTGFEIAQALHAPLNLITVRKIGHPSNPEYAIGAVDERGVTLLNEMESRSLERRWLRKETAAQQKEAARRAAAYREGRAAPNLAGKIVIITDDGIATGLTMRLAVKVAREGRPEKIIVAVPVAPAGALLTLKEEGADEAVVLEPPEEFMGAVGVHYTEFDQVGDKKVVDLMQAAREAERAGLGLQ